MMLKHEGMWGWGTAFRKERTVSAMSNEAVESKGNPFDSNAENPENLGNCIVGRREIRESENLAN